MLRYYITDRKAIGGTAALLQNVQRLGDRVDLVQVRERDLAAGQLADLVRELVRIAHPSVRILVNDRADIAIACGAQGVHLRGDAVAVGTMRAILPASFRISVSCHSIDEVRQAANEGADYALLGPVFATPGKGLPLGLDVLHEASICSIPVLALGGVREETIADCEIAGAAGVAGIRLFQSSLRLE